MKHAACFLLGVVALAVVADPVVPIVSNVSLDASSAKRVNITYDLADEDAIVTFDIQTNGVSIGKTLLRNATGDVFTVVSAGTGRKIVWNARAAVNDQDVKFANAKAVVTAWKKGAPPDYYVLDLTDGTKAFYESEDQLPLGIDSDVYRTTKMVFRRIHAACQTFVMGAPSAETSAAGISKGGTGYLGYETLHEVSFSKDYFIGIFEVTQAQWVKVFGGIPPEAVRTAQANQDQWKMPQSWFNNGSHAASTLPVHNACVCRWIRGESQSSDQNKKAHTVWAGNAGAQASFLYLFRQKAGSVDTQYDLPFEAEWEFACRAGTTTAFSDGRDYNSGADYSDIAVYNTDQPTRVGSKKPNAWGLYDMHGNVWEFCLDWAKRMQDETDEASSYVAKDAVDPDGLPSGNCPGRGGSYGSGASTIRAAVRHVNNWWGSTGTDFGFRIACPIDRW